MPETQGIFSQLQKARRGIGLDVLHRLTQIRREDLEQTWNDLIKDDIANRWRDDRSYSNVDISPHHGLDHLAAWGGDGHEEVVRGRAPGLEHLDGADCGGEVVIFRSTAAVQGWTMCEEVFKRPVVGQPLE